MLCTDYKEDQMQFKLKLSSKTILYKKSIVNNFSKTCRAIFGDDKCKVNKADFTLQYKDAISSIFDNKIFLKQGKYHDYSEGDIIFVFKNKVKKTFKIIKHIENMLEIEQNIFFDMLKIDYIILTLGCDKTLSTCSEKFKNSINFRGEPFIPDEKFAEVLDLDNIGSYLDNMLEK